MLKIQACLLAAAFSAGALLAQPASAAPTLSGTYLTQFTGDPSLAPGASQCIAFTKSFENKGVIYGTFVLTTFAGLTGVWAQKGDRFTLNGSFASNNDETLSIEGSVLSDGEGAVGALADWQTNSSNAITSNYTGAATMGRAKSCNAAAAAARRGHTATNP